MRNIKITIEGNVGSGKTHFALLIKDTLAEHGIEIEIHDTDDIPVNIVRDQREKAFVSLAESFKDRKIVLDVMQSRKHFESSDFESDINRVAKEFNYVEPSIDEIMEDLTHIHVNDISDLREVSLKERHKTDFITTFKESGEIKILKSRFDKETTQKIVWRLTIADKI
tara:strand:+ start:87 stop:590 length:504 start_codon:yes stop_codon:yes gene_type:complete